MKSAQYFIRAMLLAFVISLVGCETTDIKENEDKAQMAANWVKDRSGFIEYATSAIVRVSVYATEKDSIERVLILERIHTVSRGLNDLIEGGITDSDSIQQALKIKEDSFAPIFNAVASLVQVEMKHFRANGYGDFVIEVLSAVSKGCDDGSTVK